MSDLKIQTEHVRRAIQIFGSQTALAAKIGLSQQYVSALIRERLRCSAEAALKIDDVTHGVVSAHQLRPDLFKATFSTGAAA